ncbi:hypothetical protein CSC64_12000 [Pseudoxanthomonas koreensis]|nr:hypothetical protein CSC64_12000 [Pseudoxanthomonas koreensis]
MAGGCSDEIRRYDVAGDVSVRLLADDGCGYCRTVPYSADGVRESWIRIGKIVAANGEIAHVERSGRDSVDITFAYSFDSEKRRRMTADNVGGLIVVVAGDRAVSISRIVEPFSASSTMHGISAAEADYLIDSIRAGKRIGSR